MNDTKYKVPIISQGLSKEETIVHIAEALEHLTAVTEDMFKRINLRLDSSQKHVANISERIETATTKIETLFGTKRAIQIYSSSKYPGSHLDKPYTSIFADLQPPEPVRRKIKYKKRTFPNEPADKLQIYHVNDKPPVKKPERVTGLGELPSDIRYFNDLLLYNSGKNLYKNFVMADALVAPKTKNDVCPEENTSLTLGAAPLSISERSTLPRPSAQSYFYTPSAGQVPALDVPIDLPDLPNIADDLRYDTDAGPGIAPLNDIPNEIPVEQLPLEIPVIQEEEISEPIGVDEQPAQAEVVEEQRNEVKVEHSAVAEVEKGEEKPKALQPPAMDLRASLMDAIRQAGGAKNLKTVKDEVKEQPKLKTSGDLMADLHAKLSMRRKGISGSKKVDAGSTLERISARIPPPVVTEENTVEDNDEWDD